MGPLSNLQLSILLVFYITLVDLWGPLKARYHHETKVAKYYNVYFMVLACCATGTVNVQILKERTHSHVCRALPDSFARLQSLRSSLLTQKVGC